MEAESEGRFTYRQIYKYIKDGKCPERLEKCNKLALSKMSKFFQVQEMHFYYIGGMLYLNVWLIIDTNLLAKIVNDPQLVEYEPASFSSDQGRRPLQHLDL